MEHPDRYGGLYVVDFGPTASVGYTADEVAMLLEGEAYADAKVYRICRARPDGALELTGVPRERFMLEAGLFFYSRNLESARRDYEGIRQLAERDNLPCRAQLFLAAMDENARLPFVAGLAYPAECDQDISRWMLDHQVMAGEYADGGVSRLSDIRRQARIIDSCQLHAAGRQSRSREEVLASVGNPIQRVA